MKRIIIALWFVVMTSFLVPTHVFCGGKSDKKDTPSQDNSSTPITSRPQQVPVNPVNTETNIQNAQKVATIQYSPSVGQYTIFQGQYKSELEQMERVAGRPLTQPEREQVLDVMINERLAVQAAELERVSVTETEINRQMQQMQQQLLGTLAQRLGRPPTEAEISRARNESGIDTQAYKDQLRTKMTVEKYLMTKKASLFNSVKVPSEEEIRSQFTMARAQFVRPETIRFSGILVPYGPNAASRTRARELADSLVREIGTSITRFDAVVDRSQSPNSGFEAGDGGQVPMAPEARARFGDDFMNTAFSLDQGVVSKLIEGPDGYMLIKITEKLPIKPLELNDAVPDYFLPPGLPRGTNVGTYIGNVMLNERQQSVLAQATEELVTELRANGRTFEVFKQNMTW